MGTPRTLDHMTAEITGNVSAQEMICDRTDRVARFSGIDGGGRINLGTATTVGVLVEDQNGVILHNATITTDTDVDPVPRGVKGPLKVTTTSISNAAHTLTVTWSLKR